MNRICFVKFWKIVPVFAKEKEFVIKLLKILNWVNCSVQVTTSLGVAGRLLEELKKKCVEENFFSVVLQCVKQEKKIFFNEFIWFY